MPGVFRKLAAATEWFAGFVREVDRGIAVGRGYAPGRKNVGATHHAVRARRGMGCGQRASRGRILAHRLGRWGAGGRL